MLNCIEPLHRSWAEKMFYEIFYFVIKCFIKLPKFQFYGIVSSRLWMYSVSYPVLVTLVEKFCHMMHYFTQLKVTVPRVLAVYRYYLHLWKAPKIQPSPHRMSNCPTCFQKTKLSSCLLWSRTKMWISNWIAHIIYNKILVAYLLSCIKVQ